MSNKLSISFRKATSRTAVLFSLIFLNGFIFCYITGITTYRNYLLLFSAVSFSVVFLTKLKNTLIPRIVLLVTLYLGIFFYSLVYGASGCVEIFLLVIVGMVFGMFSYEKEKWYIYFFAVITLVIWLTLYLNDFTISGIAQLTEAERNFIYLDVMFCLLLSVVIQLYNYHRLNYEFHQNIKEIQKQASKDAEEKTNFLNTMSHEIRTPLNAINGLSYILKTENPEDHQINYINSIEYSGKNLMNMLNNYLEFSKYQGDMIELEIRSCTIQEIIKELAIQYEVECENKGILFELNLDEDIPDVQLDEDKFIRVIDNLMSNAIKFTKNGLISLSVKEKTQNTNTSEIEIIVKDSGLGISSTKQHLILDKNDYIYSLIKNDNKIGLGLPIVKHILELMNSKLSIKSKLGLGSLFQFTLELQKSSLEVDENEALEKENKLKIIGRRVLIVDDNNLNILVAQKFLEKEELIVDSANNGLEAVDKMKAKDFDLVLMDIHMPKLNGFKATEKIRKFNTKTPIYAMSGSVLDDIKEELQYYGLNGLITKPFKPSELIETLKNNIGYE
ncbi:response regulator [Polaribacter dokdonensis]|uniref:histidine kinase n=1 Tax=Polaribacter dokdonensis DSW-5 TaxID=1300348 RepID=A0A0M9CIP4_9FLAO|nr:response regulator [Polaribacter dokdonensis]KOY52959.1 Two-component system sensor histidine kinase/response regulator [Polaribacter dokdonensis DSW-5]SEE55074.1 Signal transduction histidine kinase [Polaribacter dokdonensis DSW-5]